MASHQLRTQACALAPSHWLRALALADQIEDPWYACQVYAWCGRFAPAAESAPLIEEAFRRARAGKDAYQQLAATAWPLRALIELGQSGRAALEFANVAELAPTVEPPPSRAEACFIVFQALAVGPRDLATQALDWLLAALRPAGHWRERRVVREAAMEAVTLGLAQVDDVAQLVRDGRLASQVVRCVADGARRHPRAFFWSRDPEAGT